MAKGKVLAALVLTLASVLSGCGQEPAAGPELVPPAFIGSSSDLKATQVVSTLDSPLKEGQNAIWCASFLSGWKALEQDVAQEPIALTGSPEVIASLQQAPDPRPYIPPQALYTAAGWVQKGILSEIQDAMKQKFPAKEPPAFPDIAPDSFVAYAYLEARVKFTIPYFQSVSPMKFKDVAGGTTEVNSFGVRQEDDYAYEKLRRQPKVLFQKYDKATYELTEFAVDLDRTSNSSQIIVVLTERKATLAETLEEVRKKIGDPGEFRPGGLDPNDVLLVPDIVFRLSHRFAEIEGRQFQNKALQGQRINVCQQDVSFCLDRSGVELASEAKVYMKPAPAFYVFDRPFLVLMQQRASGMPCFVMWVDNAELLRKW